MIRALRQTRRGPVVVGVLVATDAAGTWRVVEAAPYVRRVLSPGMPARSAWDALAGQGWALEWLSAGAS